MLWVFCATKRLSWPCVAAEWNIPAFWIWITLLRFAADERISFIRSNFILNICFCAERQTEFSLRTERLKNGVDSISVCSRVRPRIDPCRVRETCFALQKQLHDTQYITAWLRDCRAYATQTETHNTTTNFLCAKNEQNAAVVRQKH